MNNTEFTKFKEGDLVYHKTVPNLDMVVFKIIEDKQELCCRWYNNTTKDFPKKTFHFSELGKRNQ